MLYKRFTELYLLLINRRITYLNSSSSKTATYGVLVDEMPAITINFWIIFREPMIHHTNHNNPCNQF